jgi:hypothetical protein
VSQYARSAFPVTIVRLDGDRKMETVENLTKKYDQLALKARGSANSRVITLDRRSEHTV